MIKAAHRLTKPHGECSQTGHAERFHLAHPVEDRRLHLGQAWRPLVRATQTMPCRTSRVGRRGFFGPNVELLAPVGRSVRTFVAQSGVATKGGAVGNRERLPFSERKREEFVRPGEQCVIERLVNAVARYIDEPHTVTCRQQFLDAHLRLSTGRVSSERCNVNDG